MIRLIYYEILKLIKRKSFWILLIALLMINLLSLYLEYSSGDYDLYSRTYTVEVKKDIEKKTEKEIMAYFEYEIDLCERIFDYSSALELPDILEMPDMNEVEINRYKESLSSNYLWGERYAVLTEMYPYYKQIYSYSSYLDDVKEKFENLKDGPLWTKMSEKTKAYMEKEAGRYERLNELKLMPVNYKGIETYFRSIYFRLLIFVMICCMSLLIVKEDDAYEELVLSTQKGHRTSVLAKILCLMITGIFVIIFYHLINIFAYKYLYGFCDLSAPIQVIPSLYESTLKMSIFTYLLVSSVLFLFAVIFLGIGYLSLVAKFKGAVIPTLHVVLFVIIEGVFLITIPAKSYFLILTRFNVLNIFKGTLLADENGVMTFVFAFFIGVIFAFFWIKGYKEKCRNKNSIDMVFVMKNTSLYIQEGFRIFVTNKAGMLLIVVLLIFSTIFSNVVKDESFIAESKKEKLISDVYKEFEGEITEEKEKQILSKREFFTQADLHFQSVKKMYKEGSVSYEDLQQERRIYDIYAFEKNIYGELYTFLEKDFSYIVYHKGLDAICSISRIEKDVPRVVLLLVMLVMLSVCSSYKKEEESLYVTTYKGVKKRKRASISHMFVVMFMIFLLIEGVEIWYFCKMYPIHMLEVPIDILYKLKEIVVPTHLSGVSISTYLLYLFLVRCFAFFVIFINSMCIIRIVKNKAIGMILLLFIYLGPMFLYFIGFEFAIHLAVFDMCMGNMFLQKTLSITRVILWGIISLISYKLVFDSYKGKV